MSNSLIYHNELIIHHATVNNHAKIAKMIKWAFGLTSTFLSVEAQVHIVRQTLTVCANSLQFKSVDVLQVLFAIIFIPFGVSAQNSWKKQS